MADLRFTVDTTPMARSIDGVSRHVDGVFVAVGAMGTAVTQAEKEAAKRICDNVDKGIYTLIRSQISQKVARLRSEVMARLMELRESGKALTAMHGQMERDFNMIAARYNKLFASINASLKVRIFELERAPATLSANELPNLVKRVNRIGGNTLLFVSETLPTMQKISVAHFKANTARAINATKTIVQDSKHLDYQISSIINTKHIEAKSFVFMPIIAVEWDDLLTGVAAFKWVSAESPEIDGAKKVFQEAGTQLQASAERFYWDPVEQEERAVVAHAIKRLLDEHRPSERVSKQILILFDASTWNAPTRSTS